MIYKGDFKCSSFVFNAQVSAFVVCYQLGKENEKEAKSALRGCNELCRSSWIWCNQLTFLRGIFGFFISVMGGIGRRYALLPK